MSLAAVPVYLWGRSLVSRRIGAGRRSAGGGGAGSHLCGAGDDARCSSTRCSCWRPGRRRRRSRARRCAGRGCWCWRWRRCRRRGCRRSCCCPRSRPRRRWTGLARSWGGLRRLWPAAAGLGGLLVAWLVWRLASGGGALGGYEVVAQTGVQRGRRGEVRRLPPRRPADPVRAVPGVRGGAAAGAGAPAGRARRARARVYLRSRSRVTAWLVVEVGIFASRYSDRLVERNLIALGPVLFVGLLLWFERGAAGSHVERWAIGAIAAAVLLVLPVKRLVTVYTTHDAMTLIPLYKLVQATSPGTLVAVYSAVAAVAAARVRVFAPAVACGSCRRAARGRVRRRIGRLQPVRRRPGAHAAARCSSAPDPRWIDHATRHSASVLPLRRRASLERRLGNALLEQAHRPRLRPRRRRCRPAAAGAREIAARRHGLRAALGSAGGEVRGRIDLDHARRRARRTNQAAGA